MGEKAPSRAAKRVRRVLLGLAALVAVACVGFVVYASDSYAPGEQAQAAIAAGEQVQVGGADVSQGAADEGSQAQDGATASQGAPDVDMQAQGVSQNGSRGASPSAPAAVPVAQTGSQIAVGDPASGRGLVLYPGAKVDPRAYVPLACEFARRGVFCVVVKMPLNFAFFDMGAASRVIDEYPQVGSWWVGGHSLGGAMAAQWASGNADKVAGIALLASYAACDLSQTGLRAAVAYGSEDGVLNRDKLEECASNLPAGAQTLLIGGGNHAGFGDYGPQAGDGAASISAEEQWSQTADAVVTAMEG